MTRILIILSFLMIVSFSFSQDYKSSKEESLISASETNLTHKDDKNNVDNFMRILIEQENSIRGWIARKEIAAWSAVVLFLSILMILINNVESIKKYKKMTIVFLITFAVLFGLFIHQQLGSMIDAMAAHHSIIKWAYKANEINSVPPEFDFAISGDQHFPKSIQNDVAKYQEIIRSYRIYLKWAVPFIKFYDVIFPSKEISITTIEIEESILYYLISISTIFFIFILYSDELKVKKINQKKKTIPKPTKASNR